MIIDLDKSNLFTYTLNSLAKSKDALLYLKGRNVSVSQVKAYNLGFTHYGIKLDKDTYLGKQRLTFPLINEYSKLVGVGLRVIEETDKHYRFTKLFFQDSPGYLYGINLALPHMYASKSVLVTEGVFDVLAVQPYFPASVGLLTSSLTQANLAFLKRYVKHIFYAPDNDSAGDSARDKALKYVSRDFDVTMVNIPAKDLSAWREKDPDDFSNYFNNLNYFL